MKSDTGAETRQVTLEVGIGELPELMQVLGGFVAKHNLSLVFSELADHQTSATETGPEYDPLLVTWVADPSSEEKVAVVTHGNLRAWSNAVRGNTGGGERLGNNLLHTRGAKDRRLSPFMVLEQDKERAIGIRVDRLQLLVAQLESGALEVTNLSSISIALLSSLSREIFSVAKPQIERA